MVTVKIHKFHNDSCLLSKQISESSHVLSNTVFNSGVNNFRKNALTAAIAILLPLSSIAEEFNVSQATDDGTGLIDNSLSWAILQANTLVGADIITLKTDVRITGVMKRIIDSDITLRSDATKRSINGDNNFRPLFIKSGQVNIDNVDFTNGKAQGGSAEMGGSGAGLGGSLFIYGGNVSLRSVSISNSQAFGGLRTIEPSSLVNNGTLSDYLTGGGGMFGSSEGIGFGGGGLFASNQTVFGGYGGYDNYNQLIANFGRGGDSNYATNDGNQKGLSGGFGGGGGYGYFNQSSMDGSGGFGGGGGSSYNNNAGNGGFGGGGGYNLFCFYVGSTCSSGTPGYGALNDKGAGMGGAIFIRSGDLNLINVSLQNNQAGDSLRPGLGGALYIMHSTTNSNGNNQGMPSVLPTVNACSLTLINNLAANDANISNNNDDLFDLANNLTNVGECIVFNNSFE